MRNKAIVLMFIQCVLAASNVIFLSQILKSFNPESLLFFRWLIVLVVLFPIVAKTEGIHFPRGKNLILLVAMGLTSVVLCNMLAFRAYETTTAINIGFIGALATSITAILSYIFLKERFNNYKIFGIILAFVGVIVTLVGMNYTVLLRMDFQQGDLFILLATIVNCVYAIIGKYVSNSGSPTSIVMWSSLLGWLLFIPVGISKVEIPVDLDLTLVMMVLYTAIVATLVTRWLFMKSIRHLTASEAGIINNFMPMLTAIFSFIFLGEKLGANHFIGWLIITTGVLLFYKKTNSKPGIKIQHKKNHK